MSFAEVNQNMYKAESYGVQKATFVGLGIDLFPLSSDKQLNQRFPRYVHSKINRPLGLHLIIG